MQEDRDLLSVNWSGKTGASKTLPSRPAGACKKRLQLISKHLPMKILRLHVYSPKLVETVEAIMRDEEWHAAIQRRREELRQTAADPAAVA